MDSLNEERRNRCRLPEGLGIADLCAMKGIWPKRALSQDELLETYKNHYRAGHRSEAMRLVEAFVKIYGESAYEVVREVYSKAGKEEGEAAKRDYGSLLNKMIDYSVRPYCYQIQHEQSCAEKIVYKVLRCPLADLLKEMKLDEMGRHICFPYHDAFAKVFGFKISMPQFLPGGDDCCEHIWEKLGV